MTLKLGSPAGAEDDQGHYVRIDAKQLDTDAVLEGKLEPEAHYFVPHKSLAVYALD
jgi:hypothetical protein